MARLLPLLILVAAFIVFMLLRQQARPRSDRVYRPRANPFGWRRRTGARAPWAVHERELEGVRDAYSSASIDRDRPLFRCGGCQAWYHDSSLRTLERENAGRCALCNSDDLREVRIV